MIIKIIHHLRMLLNVKTFLNVNKPNAVVEAAKEVISEALPVTGVVDNDKYDEIEKIDEKKKTVKMPALDARRTRSSCWSRSAPRGRSPGATPSLRRTQKNSNICHW